VDEETIEAWRDAGGTGPVWAQIGVCWGESEQACRRIAHEVWPNTAIRGQASQELPSPVHFAELAQMVTEQDIAEAIPCGPALAPIEEKVQEAIEAGVTHVYLHQIGPHQVPFLEMAQAELLPRLRRG
jgi:hypothetical protein